MNDLSFCRRTGRLLRESLLGQLAEHCFCTEQNIQKFSAQQREFWEQDSSREA
jgi:hypothetical protein